MKGTAYLVERFGHPSTVVLKGETMLTMIQKLMPGDKITISVADLEKD